MRRVDEALPSLPGCRVDQPPALASRAHAHGSLLAAEEDALGVDVHDLVPVGFAEVFKPRDCDDTGVLHGYIDLAQFFGNACVERLDLTPIRDVDHGTDHLAACGRICCELRGRLVHERLVCCDAG